MITKTTDNSIATCYLLPATCPASLSTLNFIDLQWFAAEDEGRTLDPTERKVRKVREEEGRLARSQDLVASLVLLLPALALLVLAPYLMRTFMEMVEFYVERSTQIDPVGNGIAVRAALYYLIRLALPLLAVSLVAGFLANFAQLLVPPGFMITLKPLGFKFSRIVPHFGEFFRRGLFSANGLWNFAKSLIKIAVIGGAAFLIIRSEWPALVNLQTASLWQSVSFVASLAARLLLICSLILLALSLPDYLIQRWQFIDSLKMTTQEFKEEMKEEEGDPQVKGRIQQRMREILQRNLREIVPEADVVVTNPTHFANALRYDETKEYGPRLLVKGADDLAQDIKRIAREHNVPIVENKPLARAIYDMVPEGEIVPERYWNIIATILAKVRKVNDERRKQND
jgi:flagellar biosynthetic protein FlhB